MKRLLLFLLLIPIAAASYISIQSSITTTENETTITVTNFGDEPAYDVQLSLDINNQKAISNIKKQLNIKETFKWEEPLTTTLKNPGKYPSILTTNYQDANAYPFSAISVSTLDYKQATISDISANMDNIELSEKGKLVLTIKNLAENPKDLNIRLIAPKELTSDKGRLSINLEPKSEKAINFEIKRFSALAGSSYAVFAVIEYDEDNRHYTTHTSGIVKIIEKKNIFTNHNLLITLLVLLIIIFIYFQFRKKK